MRVIRLIKSWPFFKCLYIAVPLRSCLFFFFHYRRRPFVDYKSYGRYLKNISVTVLDSLQFDFLTFAGFTARQRFTAVSSAQWETRENLCCQPFLISYFASREPSKTLKYISMSFNFDHAAGQAQRIVLVIYLFRRLLILSDFLNTIRSPRIFVSDMRNL